MAKSLMWAVNGDQSSPKPTGVSPVYIVNGDTSIPRPAGVSEVYAVNGDTSIPRPAGVSSIFIEGVEGTVPSGVSVVSIPNYSGSSSGVPAKTMRFDFKYDHFNPIEGLIDRSDIGATWTHVEDDVYDFHYDSTEWTSGNNGLFNIYRAEDYTYPMSQHQFDIIDMNLEGVTTVAKLFNSARQLKEINSIRNTSSLTSTYAMFWHNNAVAIQSVPLFDTSHVTDMYQMFYNCKSLKQVPLFDTSSATDVGYMFADCHSVEGGSLALYQQMSTQSSITSHGSCFSRCGRDTETGAAELAQIPISWGGTMSA